MSAGCLPKLDLLARAHCSTTNSTSTMTEWLVIETQYPTEYGCYRGRQWTRLDLIRRSDVSVHGPFTSYEAAKEDAKERAESDCRFEGYDFEEFWPGEPPYDSSRS